MFRKKLSEDLCKLFNFNYVNFEIPKIESEKNVLYCNILKSTNIKVFDNKIKSVIDGRLFVLGQSAENKSYLFSRAITLTKDINILNKFVFFDEEENVETGDDKFNSFFKRFNYFYEDDFVNVKGNIEDIEYKFI